MLFGTTVLLTPEPMDIVDGGIEIDLDKPISAITSGAALYLDVSSMRPPEVNDILETRSWVDETFSSGFVSVNLFSASGKEDLELSYRGSSSWGKEVVYLMLTARSGVPVGVEYDRLTLKTDIDIHDVRIIWKNYRH
ncbi:hypothetical protein [Marinimicrobium alkaliphilum]|uniref:hypothetical protein n=1 Tax=Marinimicrobium alkaliphilum TaxID=2202654 RepID=UPI0018E09083|nr:hypothetical protein [Marinimicrobium alkaliphilum]